MSPTVTRLYLKNLPSVTRDDVFNYLERFGRLTELKIIESDSVTYGFAQFSTEAEAQYVLDTFRDRLFLGHRMYLPPHLLVPPHILSGTVIEPARPLRKDMPSIEAHSARNSDSRTANSRNSDSRSPRYGNRHKHYPNRGPQCRYPVLVENIPRHICWQELKDFGRLSGLPVAYCEVDRLKNGRGFIEYLSRDDAEDAVQALNGQKLGGRAVSVRAHSSHSKPRRSSRSRSPMRRTSHRTHDDPHHDTDGEPRARGRCASRTSAPRYTLGRSPDRVSSQDPFPSQHLYSNEAALPIVLHSDFDTFSKALESCRTALSSESAEPGGTLISQPSSYIEPSYPVAENYYNLDQYLRSYSRNPLEYLPGCFS